MFTVSEFPCLTFSILPRPRGGDWLTDDVREWSRRRVDTVVSLLQPHEIAELDISDEANQCSALSIAYISFPIPDRGVPESHKAMRSLAAPLAQSLRSGAHVAVHCRAGIGRSGLVGACILLHAGVPLARVFPAITKARGLKVPDTSAQAQWVRDYAAVI